MKTINRHSFLSASCALVLWIAPPLLAQGPANSGEPDRDEEAGQTDPRRKMLDEFRRAQERMK